MDPLSGRRRESNPYNCEDEDPQEPFHQHQPPFALPPPPFSPSTFSARQSGEAHPGGGPSTPFVEKEHMFDKVVTPSDVGKLNRLVIPKQHAEKYFPLDAAAGENGLLLSFEDRTGKHWRFRYSYWNSSQSYVMTKGWSRFVKEKHLDAGDTVSFGRGVGEAGRHRLFIDWKHRPGALPLQYPLLHRLPLTFHGDPSPVAVPFPRAGAAVPWGRLVVPPPPSSLVSAMAAYDRHLYYGHNPGPVPSNPYLHLRSAGNPSSQVAVQLGIGSGGGDWALGRPIFEPVTAAQGGETVGRTVRLFGVNLGCSPSAADTGGDAAAAHGNVPPPALPLPHMRPGAPEVEESPGTDQQPASMDMAM